MPETKTAAVIKEDVADAYLVKDAAWEKARALLQQKIGAAAFQSWVAAVSFQSFSGGILTLSAPTRFIRDWVMGRYLDALRESYAAAIAAAVLRVDMGLHATPVLCTPMRHEAAPANVNPPSAPGSISSPLDARFTFDHFVVGAANELAFAAARRVAEDAAASFNPLFLTGRVGLGKTHLMQAAAAAIRSAPVPRRVLYLSAEKFMFEFVRALRGKDTHAFKEQLRSVDVLMIDDIQFICGKGATQEEFFHTFNALADQGKQIVISSDRLPAELDGLDERLRSRLGGGLVAVLQPPDAALRLAILKSKCAVLKRDVDDAILTFLAENITASVRELEGGLHRLLAHGDLLGRVLTLAEAQRLLSDLIRAAAAPSLTIEDIQRQIAQRFGLTVADLNAPRRTRVLARPRQIAMYLCKTLTAASFPEIGRKFGGRDHTTVLHAVRTVEKRMNEDTAFRAEVEGLAHTFSA